MNAPDITFKVAKRFHDLRHRYFGVRVGIGIAIAVIALLSVWMLLTAGDYVWEWALAWRKVGLLFGTAAACVWFAGRIYAIIRDTRQRRFAAKLESSFEDFGQRIRTVLDTVDGRVSGPDEMLTALGHQTLGRWETLTPAQLIPSRKLVAAGVLCMAMSALAIGLFISGGDLRTAMLRALGQEIPYTTLAVSPGDARLLEGSPVELSLALSGRTDRDVMLRYREIPIQELVPEEASQGGDAAEAAPIEWIESELLPEEPKEGEAADSRRAKFAAAVGKATNAIEYQFVTSVGTTRVYRVDVQPMIDAKRIETGVEPPDYTRLESRSFATADVTVLEQSKVTVTIETNHPLRQAKLEIGAKPSKLQPVGIEPGDDPALWAFQLPSDDSIHWRFTGSGRDGTPMTPVKGRLRVRRDKAPGVTWQDPPDEIRVHTLAELPMRVKVSDDYGVEETGIVFQLGGDDEYVLTEWFAEESDSESPPKTRVPLEEILPLESLALSERDYISYYAYAVDNRASGPHRTESDVRYIDIRPLRQFYSEIEQDPNNGAGGRVIVQLNEIIRRQRFLINRTRKLLSSSNVDLATQLGTIDRMVESQSELAGLVRFLAEFFVSRGNDDVEALNQAEAAMLQASDSLAAGSFDLALVQEEDALRALAEARRTLEIALLKNPTPQQQQAFRRLARQLRQKLRRERPETEKQLADTLQKIASQQSQLGQMAARIQRNQNNPNGSSGQGGKRSPNAMSQQGTQPQESQATSDSDPADPEAERSAEQGSQSPESEVEDGEQPDDGKPQGGESQGDDEPQDRESGGQGSEEPQEESLAEQQEQLFARQIDLLERVQDIQEELADRLADSPLMAQRMKDAIEAMDDLGTQAREERFGDFAGNSEETADQLREIGIQLDALAAGEPVARVSAIRDMTTSLANMERELSDQLNSNNQSGRSQPDSKGQQGNKAELSRQARRMRRRAETVEDLLKAPVAVGDVETSEVNDNLQRFIEENEFMEQLEQTRDAASELANQDSKDDESDKPSASSGDEAMERAVEYAQASRILDDLYRQLVTPRMARLREIEKRANKLAQQLGGGGKSEEDPEAKSGLRRLQQELEEEGLTELAELLTEMDLTEEEMKEQLRRGNGLTEKGFNRLGSGNVAGRVLLVVEELRARIQEMILLEISADRDAPVPSEYRAAVDRYFRVLAGEATSVDANPSDANTIDSGSAQ